MTSEKEAAQAQQERRKAQRSNSLKRIRAKRAEQDGAPLGESTFTDEEKRNKGGSRS